MVDGQIQCCNRVAAVGFEYGVAHHRVVDKRQSSPSKQIAYSGVYGVPEGVAHRQDDGVMTDNDSIVLSVCRSTDGDAVTSQCVGS